MKVEFSWQIFEKYSNIKFRENPSSGSQAVLCGQTYGRTARTKLILTFPKFANVPKNKKFFYLKYAKSMLFNMHI